MADITNVTQEAPRKGGNCCLYGCLSVVVLLVVLGLAGYFGVRYAFNQWLNTYTSPQPLLLEKVDIPSDQLAEIQARWDDFSKKTGNGEPAAIELTSRELNALIQNSPEWSALKNQISLELKPGVVDGQLSVNLESFSKQASGRYFNGQGTFAIACQNGILDVKIKSLTVANKPVGFISQFIGDVNLAEQIYSDPEQKETVEKLKRINRLEVDADRLLIEANQPVAR